MHLHSAAPSCKSALCSAAPIQHITTKQRRTAAHLANPSHCLYIPRPAQASPTCCWCLTPSWCSYRRALQQRRAQHAGCSSALAASRRCSNRRANAHAALRDVQLRLSQSYWVSCADCLQGYAKVLSAGAQPAYLYNEIGMLQHVRWQAELMKPSLAAIPVYSAALASLGRSHAL